MNCAWNFSQSDVDKYFEWIIIIIKFYLYQNGKNYIFTNTKTPTHSFQIAQYLLKRFVKISSQTIKRSGLMLKTYLNSTGFNNNIFTTYWVKQALSYYSIKNQFTFKSHKLILFDLSVCTMNFEIFTETYPCRLLPYENEGDAYQKIRI